MVLVLIVVLIISYRQRRAAHNVWSPETGAVAFNNPIYAQDDNTFRGMHGGEGGYYGRGVDMDTSFYSHPGAETLASGQHEDIEGLYREIGMMASGDGAAYDELSPAAPKYSGEIYPEFLDADGQGDDGYMGLSALSTHDNVGGEVHTYSLAHGSNDGQAAALNSYAHISASQNNDGDTYYEVAGAS